MESVQAVDIARAVPVHLQDIGDREKADRLRPEVIGRKVMYPWVDQKDIGGGFLHGESFTCGTDGSLSKIFHRGLLQLITAKKEGIVFYGCQGGHGFRQFMAARLGFGMNHRV